MADWKPQGYTSAAPYLVLANAQASVDFLKSTFGASELRFHRRPDGSIMHGEMRLDDTVIMLSDATEGWPALAAHVHVYVADVDAVFSRALAAGGVAVMAPAQKDDADKRGGVKDAGGATWWIATQVGVKAG